jgi:hypothetical protein
MVSTQARARQVRGVLICGLLGSTIFLLGGKKDRPKPPPDTKPADMKAPGDCEDDEYQKLKSAVDTECGAKDKAEACDEEKDSCVVLADKATKFQRCAAAREERENKCFRGGDDGHKTEIANTKNGAAKCLRFLLSKCKGQCLQQ